MNKLKDIRKEKKLSGTKIAESLHVSPNYYYELERGDKRLNEDILRELVKILNTTSDEILGIEVSDDMENKMFKLIKKLPEEIKKNVYTLIETMVKN